MDSSLREYINQQIREIYMIYEDIKQGDQDLFRADRPEESLDEALLRTISSTIWEEGSSTQIYHTVRICGRIEAALERATNGELTVSEAERYQPWTEIINIDL